jgi:hypothetical protein
VERRRGGEATASRRGLIVVLSVLIAVTVMLIAVALLKRA